MKTYTFQVVIEKEPEDAGYYAYVPALPGCFSNGSTMDAARRNIQEAIGLHLETLIEHGEAVPSVRPEVRIEEISVSMPVG